MMRLILDPIPEHPGHYVLNYEPRSGTTTPDEWNGFVNDVWAWLAERGNDYNDHWYRVVRLTDDEAFETKMRWG